MADQGVNQRAVGQRDWIAGVALHDGIAVIERFIKLVKVEPFQAAGGSQFRLSGRLRSIAALAAGLDQNNQPC